MEASFPDLDSLIFLHQHGKAHSQPWPQCSLWGKQPQAAPGVRNSHRRGACRSCGCPPGCLNWEPIKKTGTFLFLKPIHSRVGAENLLQKHLPSPLSPLAIKYFTFCGINFMGFQSTCICATLSSLYLWVAGTSPIWLVRSLRSGVWFAGGHTSSRYE